MQDTFEALTQAVVGKNALAQPGTVEMAVAVDHVGAEYTGDFVECDLPGFDQFATEQVGVYDSGTEAREMIAGGRLAAADTAGQTDCQPRPANCR